MSNKFKVRDGWTFWGKFNDGHLERDSSGSGNTLTNSGVAYDGGAKFVRSEGDYLYRPHADLATGFPGTTGYTDLALYCEFTLASLPSSQFYTLVSKYKVGGGGESYFLTYHHDGTNYRLRLGVWDGVSNWSYTNIYVGALSLANRYAVAVSLDDSMLTGIFKLYDITGDSVLADSNFTPAVHLPADDGDFYIGAYAPSTHAFDGTIHELAIANTTKTEADFDAMAAGVYGIPTKWATYRLYWDWDGDGDFSESSEELTSYRRNTKIYYGCSGSPVTSKDEAGKLICTLDNSTGIFSKGNEDGAYYGHMVPGQLVRFTEQIGAGAETTLFQGDFDDIQLNLGPRASEHTAILTATGVIGRLVGVNVSVASYADTKTGSLVGAILNAASFPAGDRSIDAGQSTIGRYALKENTEALSALRDIENAEYGKLRESKDGKLIFESRAHRLSSPHTVSQATYSLDPSAAIRAEKIIPIDTKSDVYLQFSAQARTTELTNDQLLWSLSGSPVSIAAGATVNLTAVLPTNGQYLSCASWTTISYEANTASNGTGTDVTASVSIVQTKYGDRQDFAITNSGGVTAYLISLKAYGIAITEGDPVEISDTVSGGIGKGTYPYQSSLITSVPEATGWVAHGKALYGTLRNAVTITLDANASAANLAEALRVNLSDRITVDAGASSKLFISGDYWVERIEHNIDEQGRHETQLRCAEIVTHTWGASSGDGGSNAVIAWKPPDVSVNADTGQPSGDSGLTINVGEGLMWFSFNRPTANYRGVKAIGISLGVTNTHHGPYAAQRAAYPADVLKTGTLTVVAGKLSYDIASGTPNAYIGKTLLIFKTGDAGLNGNVITSDTGSEVGLNTAFPVSGAYNYAVTEPTYTLNAKDYIFDVPAMLDCQIEDTVWRTHKVPIEAGTWYAQGMCLNNYGLSATIMTSAKTTVSHTRTGSTFRTGSSGARVQIDPTNGLRGINSSGTALVTVTAAGRGTMRSAATGTRVSLDTTDGLYAYDSSDKILTSISTADSKLEFRTSATGARTQHDATNGYCGIDASDNVLAQIDKATGKLTSKSAASGARMEYDQTNGIRVYDSSGNLVSQWGPSTGISLGTAYSGARVTFDATNGIRGINSSGTVESQLLASSGLLKIKQIYSLDYTSKIDLRTEKTIFLDTNTSTYEGLKIYESSGDVYIASVAGSNRGSTPGNIVLQGGRVGSTYNKIKIVPAWAGTTIHVQVDENGTEIDGPFTAKDGVNVDSGSVYKVNGTQVVGAQGAAVADATGAGDVVAQLNALLARCRAHGLIAT